MFKDAPSHRAGKKQRTGLCTAFCRTPPWTFLGLLTCIVDNDEGPLYWLLSIPCDQFIYSHVISSTGTASRTYPEARLRSRQDVDKIFQKISREKNYNSVSAPPSHIPRKFMTLNDVQLSYHLYFSIACHFSTEWDLTAVPDKPRQSSVTGPQCSACPEDVLKRLSVVTLSGAKSFL